MSTLTDQLTTLREALCDVDGARDGTFHRVFNNFLDLTRDTELIPECQPIEDDRIRAFLEAILRQFTRNPNLALKPIPVFQHVVSGLVHGPLNVGKRTGGFFFFLAGNRGLLALTDKRGHTDYLRFSTLPVTAGAVVVPSAGADYN